MPWPIQLQLTKRAARQFNQQQSNRLIKHTTPNCQYDDLTSGNIFD